MFNSCQDTSSEYILLSQNFSIYLFPTQYCVYQSVLSWNQCISRYHIANHYLCGWREKWNIDNIGSLDKVAVLLGKLSWMESNSSTSHNPWSGVTILLSLTVFLNMVAETMPVTSSNPLLGNATQAVCGCEVLWSLNTNMLTVVLD